MESTHGRACQPSRDQLVHEKQNCIIGDDIAGRCALNVSRAGLCPYAHHADCSEKVARSFWFGSCVGNRLQASRLGKAVYTAIGPNTPMRYGAQQCVIMARALPGNHSTYAPRTGTDRHDSWSDGPGSDWLILKRAEQLLPVYVLHF